MRLALAIESAELRVTVGPQSDARLADLFDGPRDGGPYALGRDHARPGHRKVVYGPGSRAQSVIDRPVHGPSPSCVSPRRSLKILRVGLSGGGPGSPLPYACAVASVQV
ncbi:hypothetical protein, partial [Streptomyces sp. NPDC059909]|uniref:hypothetical protein n=1 Tax=Streptomyces sp. NPDC059909 TaxID=3346998 RepID=UPI003655A018